MAPPPVLSIRDLTVRYGASVAVEGLSLRVQAGEVYGLLGPNGSGKSSTLSAIAGTIEPAAGSVRVGGVSRIEDRDDYLGRIGVVPQELALFEDLRVEDNLRFFARLYGLSGRPRQERVEAVLEFVHLTEQARVPARTLSGGMQRRLNLGCALLHEPDLLLLDEPTVGLDVASRDAIFENLRDLRGRGTALVFTTHHLEEAEQLCDRIGLMNRGRLVAEGTLDELDDAIAGRVPSRPRPRLERVFLALTARSTAQP